MSVHVLAWMNTDPADGRAINFDTKPCCGLFRDRSAYELMRVVNRVWMWKRIAYGQPHFAIVCVPGHGLGVVQSPWADRASFEHELHRLLAI
jgi:hypothetical protein